jgi:uncharacterized protein YjbJ (UPF0337 family)
MNRDILQGKWKQVRGEIRKWWGRATGDDVERIAGEMERLIGALQEHYGRTLEKAQRQAKKQLAKPGGGLRPPAIASHHRS